jgi:nitrate reductase cytochrome c-type subunit
MRSLATAIAGILFFGVALAADPIPDSELGLSRTSVFDTPVPEGYDFDGSAEPLPNLSTEEAPVIPHEVRSFEKITVGQNRCLRCHLLPEQIGAVLEEGEATPIPLNHYLRPPEPGQKAQLDGGRWVCTQCHVAQANAPALVGNRAIDE